MVRRADTWIKMSTPGVDSTSCASVHPQSDFNANILVNMNTWTSHIETSCLFTSLTPSWFSHITDEALALTLAYQDRCNKIITDQKLCKEDVNWEFSNCTFVKHTHSTVGIIHLPHDFLLALLIGVGHTAPDFTQLPFKNGFLQVFHMCKSPPCNPLQCINSAISPCNF